MILRLIRLLDRRTPEAPNRSDPSIKRILAFSNTALGDTLMSTPALRALRQAYRHAHITLVIHPALEPLFTGLTSVDELVSYNGRWHAFLRMLWRLRGHDMAVILHSNEPQATPLAYFSGARYRFKLPNTSRWSFLLTNSQPVVSWEALGHGIDQRLAVVRLAGVKGESDRRMEVPDHPEGAALLGQKLAQLGWQNAKIIALQPGASTSSRRWPATRFVELAKLLIEKSPDLHFVVTGSPGERELCAFIAKEINKCAQKKMTAWASAGEIPIVALPSLFQTARVLVTGDTGPMHLAIALGTPVVGLFAVSDPARSGPAYDFDKHIVIRKWRTCDPCLSKRCIYADPPCMGNISASEVLDAVMLVLNRREA